MRIAWIAESDTMTEVPSSADAASTTSMPRPCSSCTRLRAARPSAVGTGQLVVHHECPQAYPLDASLDHVDPSVGCRFNRAVRSAGRTRGRSRRARRTRSRTAPDLPGPIQAAEGAVHDQAQVLVAPRQDESQGLIGEEAVEQDAGSRPTGCA
jgi:hypothetical protein